MDARCIRCGEPWAVFSITDEAEYIGCTPEQALKRFKREGCGLFGQSCVVYDWDAGDFVTARELAEMMGLLD